MRALGLLGAFCFVVAVLPAAGCGDDPARGGGAPEVRKPGPPKERQLRIFHAAGLTALLDDVRADCRKELGIVLVTEGSGSQMACRKLTELKRGCDLLMLADSLLVGELLRGACSWRMDFATDEVVVAVGKRAPNADLAEKDWPAALLAGGVRFGRVDENLGPIGYRTLLALKLQEMRGNAGLYDRALKKCARVVDDHGKLTPLLGAGELDYAFVYRSGCIGQAIRFIRLDDAVNLGSMDVDYSKASVTFEKLKSGQRETVTVRGGPVVWTLTVPDSGADAASAAEFVDWLLTRKAEALDRSGLRPIRPPLFYGPEDKAAPFKGLAKVAGELK
jgi:molybdate/tungstate transport system substrate-binding protein